MKYLALLVVMEIVFCAFGVSQVDDDVVRIEGPPPRGALPEMLVGAPGHSQTAVPLVVQNGSLSPRTLIFEFHLSAGRYDQLFWAGHGLNFPAAAPVLDFWRRPIATIISKAGDAALASPERPLIVPGTRKIDPVRWLAERVWMPLTLAALLTALWRRYGATLEKIVRPQTGPALENWPWLLMAGVMMGAWLALFIPGAVRYEVGDDPAMEMLASGYVTGQPSPHLVFINVIYGFILQALYTCALSVPWYPLLLLGLLLASFAGSAFLVFRATGTLESSAWLWLLGVGYGGYFAGHLQFTSVAYLVGLLGLFLFSLRTSRAALAWGVALVFLGSLIRFDSFLLLVVTALPAAWLTSSRARMEKLIFVLAAIALAVAGKTFDYAYSARDPGWTAYGEYNLLRGDLHMNPKFNFGAQNQPAFAHVGWSPNDFSMFEHWLYEDSAVFSASHLAYLDRHLTSDRNGFSALILLLVVIALAPLPVLIFCAVLLRSSGHVSVIRLAVILLPGVFILGYLAVTARLPARVALPPLYAASLFLLLGWKQPVEVPRNSFHNLCLALIFWILAFFSIRNVVVTAAENCEATRSLESDLRALEPAHGQVIVASINAIPLERLSPFRAVAEMRRLDILQLMWSGGSPSFNQQLQQHGSTSLFQSLEHDPRFRFAIPTAKWEYAHILTRYWEEHDHATITLEPATLPDGSPAVFSNFTLVQAAPAAP